MKVSTDIFSQETKERAQQEFKRYLNEIGYTSILEEKDMALLNITSILYNLYPGNTEINLQIKDEKGNSIAITHMPHIRVAKDADNEFLYKTIASFKTGIYPFGIPILVKKDELKRIKQIIVQWNIEAEEWSMTITHIAEITPVYSEGHGNVYEVFLNTLFLDDTKFKINEEFYQEKFMSNCTQYYLFRTNPFPYEGCSRKIIRLPRCREYAELQLKELDRHTEIEDILGSCLGLSLDICKTNNEGGKSLKDLLQIGMNRKTYINGMQKRYYRLGIECNQYSLCKTEAPFLSCII